MDFTVFPFSNTYISKIPYMKILMLSPNFKDRKIKVVLMSIGSITKEL